MEEERREHESTEEQPQVYTVKKELTGWRFDRRTFLAAAGTTAAAAAAGTLGGCGQPTPQEQIVVVDVVATASHTPTPAQEQVVVPTQGSQDATPPTATQPPPPTEASQPTDVSAPTSTHTPTPTLAPEAPQAQFVKDVTVPDGTVMKPQQGFTKTWRYRNSGSVPWGEGVKLVFVQGSFQGYQSQQMGGPNAVDVPNVAPGNNVDISVKLVAPAQEGKYRSYWRLQLPNGEWLEENHYVEIVVKKPTPTWTPTSPAPPPPACGCDGHCGDHGGCGCDGDCSCDNDKHYWHPN